MFFQDFEKLKLGRSNISLPNYEVFVIFASNYNATCRGIGFESVASIFICELLEQYFSNYIFVRTAIKDMTLLQ